MRRLGMTRVFGNPGSTEIPFLTDFPDDLEFVLGLHEGAVVGMASGYALGTGRPAFVNLHTAAGLGNAVNAIVCARDNRVPLVIVVGQQDRRQLALGPFLTGRNLERLAGDYPVWTTQPAHPDRGPRRHRSRLARGASCGAARRSWSCRWGTGRSRWATSWAGPAAPARLLHAPLVDAGAVAELAELVAAASSPALVVGAGPGHARGLGGGRRPGRAARVPGVAGHVLEPARLPAGSPAVRRSPAVAAQRAAGAVRRQRPRARDRHAGLPALHVRPRAAGRGDDARGRRRRRPGRRAAQPLRARAAGRAGGRVRRARREPAAAQRGGRDVPAAGRTRAARRGGAARTRARHRRPRGAACPRT